VENAVKIARAYTKKRRRSSLLITPTTVVPTSRMALTAKSMPYKHGFGPFAPEVYRAHCPSPIATTTDGRRARGPARHRSDGPADRSGQPGRVIIEPIQEKVGSSFRLTDSCRH
jgi:4-aminobutyrate aminotransferase/(S)-3-amino-2-methylpropionate transaminase